MSYQAMTVGQLMDELKQFSPDLQVFIYEGSVTAVELQHPSAGGPSIIMLETDIDGSP